MDYLEYKFYPEQQKNGHNSWLQFLNIVTLVLVTYKFHCWNLDSYKFIHLVRLNGIFTSGFLEVRILPWGLNSLFQFAGGTGTAKPFSGEPILLLRKYLDTPFYHFSFLENLTLLYQQLKLFICSRTTFMRNPHQILIATNTSFILLSCELGVNPQG